MLDFIAHSDKLISFIMAFFGLAGALWKGYKSIRAAIRGLHATIDEIKHEVLPNSGGSMRDAVNRTETQVKINTENIGRVIATVERLRGERAADFGMDETARWEADERGAITRVNAAMRALGGRDEWEFLGANWKNCIHRDDVGAATNAWAQAVQDARFFQCEFRVVTRDGRAVRVRSSAQVMKNEAGGVIGWQGIIRALEEL